MHQFRATYLVLRNIPDHEWSYKIEGRRRVIGRSQAAEIRLPDRFDRISRRHAEVWTDKNGVWIRDLGSRAGTCVNGVWVDHVPQAGIAIGDSIWMGGAELEVVAHVAALARMRTANCDPVETERPEAPEPAGRQLCRELSPAEIDVLLWISRGYSDYSEIGKLLHRSPLTVETEVRNMRAKLGLHSRTELMGWLKRVNSPDFAYLGGGVFASGLKSEPTDAAEPTAAP